MGSPQLAANLTRRLQEWTGARWMVAVTSAKGTPSLKEQADAKTEGTLADIHTNPLVKSALEHFPGAKIIDVRLAQDAAPAAPPQPEAIIGDEDIGFLDQSDFDEDL
jgi:DNA polymerase-3 subunit gamma/tau